LIETFDAAFEPIDLLAESGKLPRNVVTVLYLIFQQPDVAPQFLHVGHCLASPLVKMGLAFAPRPSPVRVFALALISRWPGGTRALTRRCANSRIRSYDHFVVDLDRTIH
jgi:hypothetical protein